MRSRSYFGTLWEPEWTPKDIDTEGITWYAVCFHTGVKSGKPHQHIAVRFSNAVSLATAKRQLGSNSVHLEPARGSLDQQLRYLQKDGKALVEWGDRPSQGKRKDLDEVYNMIKEGKSDLEIAERFPGQYIRNRRGIQGLRFDMSRMFIPDRRNIHVYVLWGLTGVGKSYRAHAFDPNLWATPCYGALWFDGYIGNKTILFEEFDDESIPFNTLLRLLDEYQCQLPVKGAFTFAAWTTVFITCNKSVQWWYPSHDPSPLRRRITEEVEVLDRDQCLHFN